MGTILIDVPGDVNFKIKVKDEKFTAKILRLLEQLRKTESSGITDEPDNDIVGIWKDRFDDKLTSGTIQRDIRKKTWKRS